MQSKRRFWAPGVVALAAGLLVVSWAVAQEKAGKDTKKKDAGAPDPAAATEQWMALATPGEGHKRLEHFVGEWTAKMKIWMAGPGSPPSESQGTMRTRWALGKRYLVDEYKGEMRFPDPSGNMIFMPFEGMGMTGYDNFRNLYVGTWADSMGTQLLTMTGSADAEGKVFTYFGTMDEPALKLIGRTVKYEVRVQDADHHVFTIEDLHASANHKVLEISYTRKKP
jgi:hypothetical protein